MGLVDDALWCIESRLGEALTLGDVARHCAVSRHHLARAFVAGTGRSVIHHHRGRRLSEAARRLAGGGATVLEVALDAGYGSHEAFTRAFKDVFGLTPQTVRTRGHLADLELVEPFAMSSNDTAALAEPRLARRDTFRVAGLAERYTFATNLAIPAQWQRFAPHIGHVPSQIGDTTYGVCRPAEDDAFDYICGVEVADLTVVPPEFARVVIPAQRYAVFTHEGHVSGLRGTVAAIWNEFLPRSALSVAGAPDFERYDRRFDPATGRGIVEIWIPITP